MTIEPLRVTIDVSCSAEHAFDTWTARIDLWWPKGHSVSGDPTAAVHLEPRVGGRIFERTSAGQEIDWGEVTVWQPPRQLGYLWHIRRTRAEATDVLVDFLDCGDGTTRVEITHTGWERLGDEAQTWRDANAGGWNGLLPHFVAAATGS